MSRVDWNKDRVRRVRGIEIQHSIDKARNAYVDKKTEAIAVQPQDATQPEATLELNSEEVFDVIQSNVMTITPEQAEKWLEGHTHNRPLRHNDVMVIANVMKTRKWALNGESIVFDNTGRLLDGQHRLWGCMESGTPFESVVVFGVTPDTFYTIDTGRHRSPADHLVVAGVLREGKNRNRIAAAAAHLYRYLNRITNDVQKTPAESLIQVVKDYPRLEEWLLLCARAPVSLRGYATALAPVLTLGSNHHPEKASEFIERWVSGADLSVGSPILALRQKVLGLDKAVSRQDRLYFAVVAWNAFVQGRSIQRVQSMRSEVFPKIIGE